MRPPIMVELTDASEEKTASISGLEYSLHLKREAAHSYQRVILQKTSLHSSLSKNLKSNICQHYDNLKRGVPPPHIVDSNQHKVGKTQDMKCTET
jgi:hypothetical protein